MIRESLIAASCFIVVVLVGLFLEDYAVDLLATGIVFGIFAASVDLSWGYGGVLNLGSALYFGLGAYFSAYSLVNGYGLLVGIVSSVVVCTIVATTIGFVTFRAKASSIHFGLVGLVLSLTAEQLAVGLYDIAGGSNGIAGVPRPSFGFFGFRIDLNSSVGYLVLVAAVASLGLVFLRFTVQSHFGRVLACVRTDEEKAQSLGFKPMKVKALATIITATASSIAGTLYVPLVGIAEPKLFSLLPNMLVLVWVSVGGQRSLLGPFFCAFLLKGIEMELGSQFENEYVLVLGLLFVAVVRFWPGGAAEAVRAGTTRLTAPGRSA